MNNKSNFTDVNAYMGNLRTQLLDTVNCRWEGYGTWMIRAQCTDINGRLYRLQMITHNEEDKTGIFDGEKYNPLCGFGSMDDLEAAAKECGMTVEVFQEHTWTDSANEDNYELLCDRNERLVDKLWEHYDEIILQLEKDFEEYSDEEQ